jgi:dihydroorotate dehydrogenase (NAD+) catalytic subunit
MNLSYSIGNVTFKNPIWTASGTFGFGSIFKDFVDLNEIGAIVTKTVTLNPRAGNQPPRIFETKSGLLNSIGLENPGVYVFKDNWYDYLKKIQTNIVISIAGASFDEFSKCISILNENDFPNAFEINLSCPNVKQNDSKKRLFAQDSEMIYKIVSDVKQHTDKLIIVKLTPNVTDISEMAEAAEQAKADAVSLVNTYLGMAVDANSMRPCLGNIVGGLSGPAIKPLALRAVFDVAKKIKIPIIGIGGIMNGLDVAEFLLCGATAVQIGTANFVNPCSCKTILDEFKLFLSKKNIDDFRKLIGGLKV